MVAISYFQFNPIHIGVCDLLVDEIDKLRGCYLVTKEDPSVIFDPINELGPMMVPIVHQHQWMLDDNCQGFKFVPSILYIPYLVDKRQHHSPV